MKEITGQFSLYYFVSPHGIESDHMSEREAKEAISKGTFYVLKWKKVDGLGPSTQATYEKRNYKIDKIYRVKYTQTKEVEEITNL